ncbi:ABC transporter ATP-binding protein [Mycolicibacterium parafortuitum]|uniref:ABC transporter ATP-binding protein n=1 Tax=Mycolicibacterium parafortuitum TaxID=39692 RepID=A0A7I7U2N9_MYCPF|nr:ATP-binding cassette domain-containing protein [Mycolicibacterium parafortuitum]BBY75620.1 ABC transporter ATP-binding protein [Mycolicibacterium parafortuitum]
MTDSIMTIEGLTVGYGSIRVLEDVSLNIPKGRITAVVGPNGAGKSTLLHALAGTAPVQAGRVLFGGQDIVGLAPYQRSRRGIMRTFQMPADFGRLTVLENLLLADRSVGGTGFLQVFTRPRRSWLPGQREAVARARKLLAEFGLEAKENDYMGDLSGGQRRILELLRAVTTDPRMLLLDEPFAGVHASIIERISDFLVQLRERGISILMVAHELDAVERLTDAVVVMARGQVLFEGSMAAARREKEVVDAYVAG